MAPTLISHYRLLDQLGEGGMGVVYRAEDVRLGREVAIKLLRTVEKPSAEWLARFEREAQLASSLQHPHICTIHELGEHEGQPFLAMERLEGRTVRQLIDGPMPPERVIALARQAADALDAAHRRGIIHRDIKPANLFVTYGDHLKVLDFGLAKLAAAEDIRNDPTGELTQTLPAAVGADLTRTGDRIGTASYMSPEQALGRPLDPRTDLFSLGSVMYEMATGRRAFGGEDIALIVTKIVNGIVVPPSAVHELPPALEAIIMRLLAVDPDERYQTAGDLLADLNAAAGELDPAAAGAGGSQPLRRPLMVAIPLALGAIVLAGVASLTLIESPGAALTDRDSLLVADFANTTGDAVFDATLVTALKKQLEQSPFLDLVPESRIRETLRLMDRPADAPLTTATAREVCERAGVRAMLEGAIAPLGAHYVITLHASDCVTGETLARAQTEATSQEQVLAALGTISTSIRETLGESRPSMRRFDVPIEQATTPSLAALKAYTLGIEERRRGREVESIAFLNQATELDPKFAAAYATLSIVYGSLGEWRMSENFARLAYEHRDRVSEREKLFITYQYHDRVTGDQEQTAATLALWKKQFPRDMRPANALAVVHNRLGRYEEGEAEALEALARTPDHPFPLSNLAQAYRAMGRYDDARRMAQRAVDLGVATTPTRRLLYQLGIMAGDGSADEQVAWARERAREFDLVSAQAEVAAFEGRMRDAAALYERAADMALARRLEGTAAGYAARLAWTEAVYRPGAAGAARVRHVMSRTKASEDGPGALLRFRGPAAYGLTGMVSEALAAVATAEQRYPESTQVRRILAPSTRAAVALYRGQPREAIAMLEPARAAELGVNAGLVPIYLRAEALLGAGDAAAAAREFQRVIDRRGVDPFTPLVPLAHLGIARAHGRLGDAEASRAAYATLLEIWRGADADFPLLAAARAEHARLATEPAAASR